MEDCWCLQSSLRQLPGFCVRHFRAGCPGRLGGIPDRFGFSCGGNQNGGGAGIPAGCKLPVADGRGRVETAAGNSNSGGRQAKRTPFTAIFKVDLGRRNLESVLES